MNWKRFFFWMLALSGGMVVMAMLSLGIQWVINHLGVEWFIGGFIGAMIIFVSVIAGLTKETE